jgi:hypothetical protein
VSHAATITPAVLPKRHDNSFQLASTTKSLAAEAVT